MPLIVEDGTGVAGAEAYGDWAGLVAYWTARPHSAFSAPMIAASQADAEGCLREGAQHMDDRWGGDYKGVRAGYIQGRLWPREGAKDGAGFPLPDLPPELVIANYEFAARAISSSLSIDETTGGEIKRFRDKTGPLEEETEYFSPNVDERKFGTIEGLLGPLLKSGGGDAPTWNWR